MASAAAGPARALIIAPQWIGDAVMAEPLLAALAERGEALTVAALPWVAPVFRAMPQVGAIVELPFAHGRLDAAARWRVAASLRGRFEVAYVLPNSIKSALLPWLAGVPRRVGYQGEGRPWLVNERLANPGGRPPMVAYYGALAGPGFAAQARPRLHIDAAARRAALAAADTAADANAHADAAVAAPADAELAAGRSAPAEGASALTGPAYWALAPGAEYGPAKRWPAAHYAALARSLHALDGAPVLLLGSPGEAALCGEIAALAGSGCRVLAGRLSLFESMAVIAAARGLVSNDSGLMHVAAALGVPQAAVFGSTSPEHTPPLNTYARVLWLKGELERDCIPCFERHCWYGDTRCLAEIEPARVLEALLGAAAARAQSENLPA